MAYIHAVTREWVGTIVYWGPGLSGKTASIKWLHDHAGVKERGRLQHLSTETDQPASFEFLPLSLGIVAGVSLRVHVYTTFGHISFDKARRSLATSADGVVFVADSHKDRQDANDMAMSEWRLAHDTSEAPPPLVLQCNKRDLPDAVTTQELATRFDVAMDDCIESVATQGIGIWPAFLRCATLSIVKNAAQIEESRAKNHSSIL